jgi:hypothetical protein
MAQLDKLLLRISTVSQSGVAVVVPVTTPTNSSPTPPTNINFTDAAVAYNASTNSYDVTTAGGFPPYAAAGQLVFGTGSGAAWETVGGDVLSSASSIGSLEVVGILGTALPAATPGPLTWTGSAWSFGPAPEHIVAQASPVPATSLVSGTTYLVDTSGGAFTQSLPTTGLVDGMWFQWFDAKSVWSTRVGATQNLTLNAGSNQVQDPNLVGITGGYATSVVLDEVGGQFRTTWSASLGKWKTT